MFKLTSSYDNSPLGKNTRIESIDILRGIVMAIMALDHCRDYFHVYAFVYSPEDLNNTTPIVFYTRWISHFCAPVFVFLTGASAYLYKIKHKATNKELAQYLFIRGLILIVLELTIVRFAWRFYIDYSSIGGLVLWAIGWSMIALAALIYLPRKIILTISLLIIFGHNLLDTVSFTGNTFLQVVWAFLHQKGSVPITDSFSVNILYPVLPMIGIAGFGYYIGKWFTNEYSSEIRSGFLFYFGIAMISLFVSLRFLQFFTEQYSYLFYLTVEDLENKWTVFFKQIFTYLLENYGDASPWTIQENSTYSIMSFLNTTKYPMSLLYILMTLGPTFILLSYLENKNNRFTKVMKLYGGVPLFYYIVHLFLIHALAIILAMIMHRNQWHAIFSGDWKVLSENYGFSMPVVYVIWLCVLGLLYPICLWYRKLKSSRKYSVLSFL